MSVDEATSAARPAAQHATRGGKRSLALLMALVVVWGLLMRQFGSGDVYAVMGPFALVVCFAVRLVRGQALRDWFAPQPRAIVVGLVVGAAMTALTYPVFHFAVQTWPELFSDVQRLYQKASTRSLGSALAWVTVLVVAEELLWRGALLEALRARTSRTAAIAISVAAYAVAQAGTGSWIVGVMALVCGALWTAQRLLTRSLLSSTLSHLIWTQTVIVLHPVLEAR
jgi:membrane protease YdiL (CAAX protease family)